MASNLNMQILDMLAVASSDEEKKKRLDEIREATLALERTRAELDARRQEIGEVAAQAAKDRQEAITRGDDLDRREARLRAEEAALGQVNDSVVGEKGRFERVRAQWETNHTEREAAITVKEREIAAKLADFESREAALAEREKAAGELEGSLSRKHAALQAAIAA